MEDVCLEEFDNQAVPMDPAARRKLNAIEIVELRYQSAVSGLPEWFWCMAAEFLGWFVFILFGIGVVASAIFTGAQAGLLQVTIVWGFGLTVGIFIAGPISGAHLNPAVTLALIVYRRGEFKHPLRTLFTYWFAQLLGGFCAGLVNYGIWKRSISNFELANNLVRGGVGSEASAMCLGEYFPNPAFAGTVRISMGPAFGVEVIGTAILVLAIFALTDSRNVSYSKAIMSGFVPYFVGLTLVCLMSLWAPLTQGGFNPARDFGPRLASLCFGWGSIAIPGPRDGFWIYIIGPLVGSLLGGLTYIIFLGSHYQDGSIKEFQSFSDLKLHRENQKGIKEIERQQKKECKAQRNKMQ